MLADNLQKVKRRWISEGLMLGPELPRDDVVSKFQEIGFTPSSDVIEVFSVLNGLDECMDAECIEFWTMARIVRENKKGSRLIGFADFLLDSHWYAYDSSVPDKTEIYVCYSDKDVFRVADSFDEFFDYYLNSPGKLFR